jgi:antitoxin component YwqK of YwqJK toxin-antitoxin module
MITKLRALLILSVLSVMALEGVSQVPGKIFPEGAFGKDYNAFDSGNKRDGVWIRVYKYHPEIMYYKGNYKHGVPSGVFEFYSENGLLKSTIDHVQDTTINDVTNYYTDGKTILSKGRYVGKKLNKKWERQKQGRWEFYDERGQLIRFENYKDNVLQGESKVFYKNGQLSHELIYVNGKLNGPFQEFNSDGKLAKKGAYLEDNFNGVVVFYDVNGSKSKEGKFVKGKKEGEWSYYAPSGQLEAIVFFKNDVEGEKKYANGTFDFYYPNEIPKAEYTYRNFLLEGKFVEYFETGHFVQIPASEEDKADGIIYREQLVDTQVKRKGSYVKGQLHGEITYFNIGGEVEKVEVYEMGKLKETK